MSLRIQLTRLWISHEVSVDYETLDIRASQDVDNYIDRIFQKSPLDGLG
jgi:hypothetical protein